MTLESVRHDWEKKQAVALVVTKTTGDYAVVFVVLQNATEQYKLHRYFPIGEKWNVSVDKQGSLEECLDKVTQAFKEVYPCLQK